MRYLQCGMCPEMLTYNNYTHFEKHYDDQIESHREHFLWWHPGMLLVKARKNWRSWYVQKIVDCKEVYEQLNCVGDFEEFKQFVSNHPDIAEWWLSIEWKWADENKHMLCDDVKEKLLKLYMLDTIAGNVVYVGETFLEFKERLAFHIHGKRCNGKQVINAEDVKCAVFGWFIVNRTTKKQSPKKSSSKKPTKVHSETKQLQCSTCKFEFETIKLKSLHLSSCENYI